MQQTAQMQLKTNEKEDIDIIMIGEKVKYTVMYVIAFVFLLSAFIFNSPREVFNGLQSIIVDPSILVSDYMYVGNIGAALFNSSILMIISITISKLNKVNMNGTTMAAVLTVGGFALFGKNIYNIWSILIGVYAYSLFKKEKFNKFILIALFGTALAPLVSQVSYGFGFNPIRAIILANTIGIIVGFILPPLAHHFIKFHQGFNLYNIGFTSGIVGTLFMAIFRAFDLDNEKRLLVAEGYNSSLSIFLVILFVAMIAIGFYYNKLSFKGYDKLLKHKGRLVEDFVLLDGFGLSMINMGILGLITTSYILLVKGQLNGPIIGGIITVVGFGAFGKHAKNIIPIMVGVFLAAFLMKWEVNATGPLLAALFGTTLAPIAGEFGWKGGIIAGFLHMAMVMNVGSLHGGMNLYNNGFSGGIVAATLVPILDSFRRGE